MYRGKLLKILHPEYSTPLEQRTDALGASANQEYVWYCGKERVKEVSHDSGFFYQFII